MNGLLSRRKAFALLGALAGGFLAPGCERSPADLLEDQVDRVRSGESDTIDVRHFPRVRDGNLAGLRGLQRLRTLILDGAPISDEGLRHVAGLTGLVTLSLSNTRVTGAGLAQLTGLPGLEILRLDCLAVGDEGLGYVGRMASLRNLSLWRCPVTDKGLAHLKGLKRLVMLSLDETAVSNEGLERLEGLPSLRYLSVWGTEVSQAGVVKIRRRMKEVRVNH
jgi:hypothetical protein